MNFLISTIFMRTLKNMNYSIDKELRIDGKTINKINNVEGNRYLGFYFRYDKSMFVELMIRQLN